MTGKRVKLVVVANENSRATSLKKRRLGLVKKVSELTILCDLKACLIMVNPNEAEPMVWPSVEAARDLLDEFFSLPEYERRKKETTLVSHLKEKTKRVHDQLAKTQKKNKAYETYQLMVQLHGDPRSADLNLNKIYRLISFSKDKIMHLRTILNFINHLPLPEPPMNPFEVQYEERRRTTNDTFMIRGDQNNERGKILDELARRIINNGALREKRTRYLLDQWVIFPSSELHEIHQQVGKEMVSCNQNPNRRCYLPYQGSYHSYQGSSSNGVSDLEMNPMGPPVMAFHGTVSSFSQPLQYHHNMNNIPIMAMNQPRQYPFEFTSGEVQSSINIGGSQFYMRSDDSLRQERPVDEATAREDNADATSFDIIRDWAIFNSNHHF
ncbi:unnamed protein product [Thlaspi arvense]|uniref:MADS-box domain-containing protein n=1 Tax=Thlaspi arvense TaxID=13288 RepID=A0AAU9S5A8_THLAR|nr:unnamed protein product [Thlaspi arvense]